MVAQAKMLVEVVPQGLKCQAVSEPAWLFRALRGLGPNPPSLDRRAGGPPLWKSHQGPQCGWCSCNRTVTAGLGWPRRMVLTCFEPLHDSQWWLMTLNKILESPGRSWKDVLGVIESMGYRARKARMRRCPNVNPDVLDSNGTAVLMQSWPLLSCSAGWPLWASPSSGDLRSGCLSCDPWKEAIVLSQHLTTLTESSRNSVWMKPQALPRAIIKRYQ